MKQSLKVYEFEINLGFEQIKYYSNNILKIIMNKFEDDIEEYNLEVKTGRAEIKISLGKDEIILIIVRDKVFIFSKSNCMKTYNILKEYTEKEIIKNYYMEGE